VPVPVMLLTLFLSVTLAAPFGTAEATAIDAGPPLEVVITVEVVDPREAVLVRMVSLAGELDPVAMASRGDGTWGVTVRLTEREDVLVAFEAVPAQGDAVISTAFRLTDLGVDPAVFTIGDTTTTTAGDRRAPGETVWLVAAVAAAVVALALLAVWAVPRRRSSLDAEAGHDVLSGNAEHTAEADGTSDDHQPPPPDP
jgi:hypothetical protein